MKNGFLIIALAGLFIFASCSSDNSTRIPEYHTSIIYDEDNQVVDWNHCGEYTPDGQYTYYGTATLYSSDGYADTFPCFKGKEGTNKGCMCVYYNGLFYNINRNSWVTINGVRYKGDY